MFYRKESDNELAAFIFPKFPDKYDRVSRIEKYLEFRVHTNF